jgi:hypothetical protein
MRCFWMVTILAGTPIAFADPKPAPEPPAPDLVFRWQEGEMSLDMSIWTTEIAVTGTKLHYARSYAGRMEMPESPVKVDATVKDPKKVAAALAALDKIKVKKAKNLTREQQMQMRSGCIRRGKLERCATASGTDADSDEMKAILGVRDALLDGVKLPNQI